MKDWEVIADNLSKAGFSWGYVSAIDSNGRTIWIVDAHRDDGNRFVVHADDLLIAFGELEAGSRMSGETLPLRYNIRLSPVLIEMSSITSSDVSTYLRHG